MRFESWKQVVGSLLLSTALLQPGCNETPGGTTGGAGGAGGATFGTSPCRGCEKNACSAEFSACDAEPECAAYLGCEDACPIAPTGDVDAACAGACPPVEGSAAKSAFDALQACRLGGAGAACEECGRSGGGGTGGTGGALCTPPAILTQTCAPDNDPSACIKCQYEKCCDSVDACFGGGPATDLTDCWLNCPANDPQCEADCFAQFPAGIPGFSGYQACLFVNCGATGDCQINSPCNLCQYQECSCEYASCITDGECFAIQQCFLLCPDNDVACGNDCRAAHPDGEPLLDALGVCTAQKCIAQCGG